MTRQEVVEAIKALGGRGTRSQIVRQYYSNYEYKFADSSIHNAACISQHLGNLFRDGKIRKHYDKVTEFRKGRLYYELV